MEALIIIPVLLVVAYLIIKQKLKLQALKARFIIIEELYSTQTLLKLETFTIAPLCVLQEMEDDLLQHYHYYLPILSPVEIGKYIANLKLALPREIKTKNFIISMLEGAILNFSAAELSNIMIGIVIAVGKRPETAVLENLAAMRNLFLEVINQRMSDLTSKAFYRIFTDAADELFKLSNLPLKNEVLMSVEIHDITKTFKFEYLDKIS